MKNFRKILVYITPYGFRVVLNVAFNLLSALFSLFSLTMLIPFLGILFSTQPMVTELLPFRLSPEAIQNNFNYYVSLLITNYGEVYALIFISMVVVVTSLLKNGFKFLALYHLTPVRNGVAMDMRNAIYKKSIDLPLSYYSKERKGDTISRMTNDVHQVELSIISSLEMVFREPITIVIYLGSLFVMSPTLTVFVLILLPVSALIIGRIGKTLKSTALRGQGKLGMILSVMEETLGGLRVIKAFNAEEKMNRRFQSLNSFYTRIMNKMYRRQYLASPVSEFLGTMVVVVIMLYGGSMILSGNAGLSSQGFIGYLAIFSQIIHPAKSFSQAWYNIQKGMASAERIEQVLSADNLIHEQPDAIPKKDFQSDISLKNVCFGYEKALVLQDINLLIPRGKKIALVGQSGSGKSTMVDLISRFYDVSAGEISMDGIPIQHLRIKDLRALIGNVNQEPILFNDTFFNNIAFGKVGASEQDVMQAARVANAHDFITATPLGYYTNIGDRGGKLSGGQRQRISIARAILHNPPILILDEATSSLDTESEKLVAEALANVMENRTSIVIAHRLSTIIHADLICVLHEGRIVEQGNHSELIALNGYYRKLNDLQMFS
jgi:ATP-binding cassette, subfamily B, bacterial MsbA